MSLMSFYNPWKYKKTQIFLNFSGGIEKGWWHKKDKPLVKQVQMQGFCLPYLSVFGIKEVLYMGHFQQQCTKNEVFY